MADDVLTVTSTTDDFATIQSVADNRQEAARIPGPATTDFSSVAYEDARSERNLLRQRIAEYEADLANPSASVATERVDSNEVEPGAEEQAGVQKPESDIDMAEVHRSAKADAKADFLRWAAEQERAKYYDQQAQSHLAPPDYAAVEAELGQMREQAKLPFNARLKTLLDAKPNGQQLVARAPHVPMTPEIADELLFRPGGAEAAIFLMEHPEKARDMVRKPRHAAVAEAIALAAKFDPAFRARPVSRAEAPIRPLSGNSAKSSLPLDQLPYAEYCRAREAQRKSQRYRR